MNKKKIQQKIASINRRSGGFTILETIIAVLIVGISISAIVVVAGGGAQKAIQSKDRLIAAYLAQEGVELVRNVRDTTFLVFEDELGIDTRWNSFKTSMAPCFVSGCAVAFDRDGDLPVAVSTSGGGIFLLFDKSTGIYSYEAGDKTIFNRQVIMTELNPGTIEVTVIVDYKEGTQNRTYTTKEQLYNWF